MIKTAKRDIRLFKTFTVINGKGYAPYQRVLWGVLKPGVILSANSFNSEDGICTFGVHGSKLLKDARLVYAWRPDITKETWAVVIPKGTRYYESTVQEAARRFDSQVTGPQIRAEKMILVKRVR